MANVLVTTVYSFQNNPDFATPSGVTMAFAVNKINIRELSTPITFQGVDCYSTIEILEGDPPYAIYYVQETAASLIAAANGSVPAPLSLEDLSDVVVSSPVDGEVLTYNSGVWINAPGGGGFSYTVVNVNSTPYTVTQTSGNIVFLVDTTLVGGHITLDLPTPVGNTAQFTFKKVDTLSNDVVIDAGAFNIDGESTAIIYYGYTSATIISDNSNWKIIG